MVTVLDSMGLLELLVPLAPIVLIAAAAVLIVLIYLLIRFFVKRKK